MTLKIDEIRCINETNEPGSDEIYFLLFIGRTIKPYNSHFYSYASNLWNDFDSGEAVYNDKSLASTWADAVYVVVMMERDGDQDYKGEKLSQLGALFQNRWRYFLEIQEGLGHPTQSDAVKNLAFEDIEEWISTFTDAPWENDDQIDVARVTIDQIGERQTLNFTTFGTHYRVTFKHTV